MPYGYNPSTGSIDYQIGLSSDSNSRGGGGNTTKTKEQIEQEAKERTAANHRAITLLKWFGAGAVVALGIFGYRFYKWNKTWNATHG